MSKNTQINVKLPDDLMLKISEALKTAEENNYEKLSTLSRGNISNPIKILQSLEIDVDNSKMKYNVMIMDVIPSFIRSQEVKTFSRQII